MTDELIIDQPFNPQWKQLHEQAADYLWQTIVDSNLQPGALLPSERELVAHLAVSRATISGAVRLLAQQGLVAVRVGSAVRMPQTSRSRRATTGC